MLTVRAWVSCGWTSRQIDKKKQQQQQRTNKHISLITLSSLYPKTKSQNRVKVFLVFIIIFYIRAIAGDPFQKTEPPPGFAVGMLGSPKTKFQGKLYGLHCLLSRSKKHVFFSFCLQSSANSVPRCLGRLLAKTYFADNRCRDQTAERQFGLNFFFNSKAA